LYLVISASAVDLGFSGAVFSESDIAWCAVDRPRERMTDNESVWWIRSDQLRLSNSYMTITVQ
jgi:hypothetical protein